MPAFGLLTGTQERSYGGLPRLPLKNLFAERAITEPSQFMLRSRPQLRKLAFEEALEQAVLAIHFTVLGSIRVYADGSVYVEGSLEGTLNDSGPVFVVSNEIGAVMTRGGDAKFWDGTTLRDIAIPDSLAVRKVLEQGGRFVFITQPGQKYYWTEPLSNMLDMSGDIVVDALDFASAENESDYLVDGLTYRDNLVLGGTRTIEIHVPTGNDDLPWAPTIGSTINQGVIGTGYMALWNNGFSWVSQDWVIYSSGGVGYDPISNEGIEEILPDYEQGMLDSFQYQGREFLRFRPADYDSVPDLAHLLLDARSGEWCEWETDGGQFIGGCVEGNSEGARPIFGSLVTGEQLFFDNDIYPAAEELPECTFRFGLPVDAGQVTIHNALLRCQTDLDTATISLRTSRDKGESWTVHTSKTLNAARKKVEWRSLGMFDQPGFLGECTVTGAAQFSVSGAMFNEFVEGRAR